MTDQQTRVVHVNDRIPGAVYIGRVNPRKGLIGSLLANPFKIGKSGDRAEVIDRYQNWIWDHPELWSLIADLRGKPIACWCRHDGEAKTLENACHGDVLVSLLERFSDEEFRAMAKDGSG